MIKVAVEVRDGAVTRRVRITASSIERALELAGGCRKAHVIFPIEPDAFFAGKSESLGQTEAA